MKTRLIRILWFVTLLFLSESIYGQTRRALVIGCGQQEDSSWGKINGDKDIPYVVGYLKKSGFKNIITLSNKKATKSAIVKGFRWLAKESRKGDIVYVHFSGHGQQMKDINGDEHDGLDECWIPYDAYKTPCSKDHGEKHLSDDEINILLKNIRSRVGSSGKILVVVDACHSGDSSRGDDEETVRGVVDVFNTIIDKVRRKFLVTSNSDAGESTNPEMWITISACKSNQFNAELKTPSVGKLTYALSQMLQSGKMKDNDSIEKELKRLVRSNSAKYPQTPVISGETDRFNITDVFQ